ncbi:syntaxin-61-like protein isoform X1 [Tanacetum coccineum]
MLIPCNNLLACLRISKFKGSGDISEPYQPLLKGSILFVKEEIQDYVNTLQATFHQWEHILIASEEQTRLTKELLSNCDSIECHVDELEKAISVAARDPS